jgi:NAD(P)-dependent dehydrogenase (short-subunit alcohol dehydrogenase family)
MPITIEGKRVIVTGGASGIGAAAVRVLAAEGAKVCSFDVNAEGGRQVAEAAAAAAPGRVMFHHVDVSKRDQVDAAVEQAIGFLSGLDAVLNIAGVERSAPLGAMRPEDLDLMFDVNVKGLIYTCEAALPALQLAGGSIVNFGSDAGLGASPRLAHYGASKGAVHAFTRQAAAEWGRYDIRVNTVIPAIWTPMYDAFRSRLSSEELATHDAMMAQRIPLRGRLGDALTDIAPLLLFLVSDGARFITGQIIAANGGIEMVR